MRYVCDDPAFAGDFVEFSDSWSRAQVRAAWACVPDPGEPADDDSEGKLLAVLRPKIVALRLTCIDANPITDPDELTPERTEEIDTVLYTWFANTWSAHLRELASLGNALGRQLWSSSATSNSKTKTTTKAQPTAHRKSRKS